MATAVGLNMKITADTAGIGRGMSRTEQLLSGVDKNARSAANSLRAIAVVQVGGALLKGLNSIVGSLTSAANAAVGYANSLRSSIDATAKLAARTGISVEALQGFQVAADLSGVQNLDGAIQRLTISIGDAASGVKGPQEAFARLGLDFNQLAKLKPENQFRAVAAAIANVGNQAEKAAVAADLFGRAGVELLPLFNSNLAEIEARAKRLGIVLSSDQTAAIERMNDSFLLVRRTLDGILGQVLANIADVVTAISEEFLQFVEAFEGINGAQGGNAIADFITKSVLNGIDSFLNVVRVLGNAFLKFADLLGKIAVQVAPLFGIDTRSEAQQRLEGLEQAGGPPPGWRSPATVAEYERTIQELRREVANERAAMQMPDIQAAFNSAIDSALDAAGKVRQRIDDAGKRGPGTDAAGEIGLAGANAAGRSRADATKNSGPAINLLNEITKPVAAFAQQKGLQIGAFAKGMFDGVVERFQKRQSLIEAIDKDIAKVEEDRAKRALEIEGERFDALSRQSNQALNVSDVRSGGISEILRIASGREDPAVEEYRKQLGELKKIDAKLGELRADRVEIVGNGARAA
jgi:hypothetical protein